MEESINQTKSMVVEEFTVEVDKQLDKLFQKSFDEATRSLSQLIQKKMVILKYNVELLTGEQFINQIEDQLDKIYFASIIKVQEEIRSNIVFLISEREGLDLFNTITGETIGNDTIISEEVVSGIGEINNILGSTFINSLANIVKEKIHASTPLNTFDMLGAVLQEIVLQKEFINKEILCAEAVIHEMNSKKEGTHVRLIIMSDKDELFKILE